MSKRQTETNGRRYALRFFAGLCAALSLPLVLVVQLPRVPAISLVWDWANALGYLGLACCLLLFIYAGRPRVFPPYSGRFFANLHRSLGYVALLLVAAHVGLLLYDQPLLLQHLKLSAPLYMLAGLAALVLLLVLCISSITALRKRIWPDYHRFKMIHAALAIGCVALSGWHIIGSSFYLNSSLKLGVASISVSGLLGYYLYSRLRGADRVRRGPGLRDSAAYSRSLSYGPALLLVIIVLALLLLSTPK